MKISDFYMDFKQKEDLGIRNEGDIL